MTRSRWCPNNGLTLAFWTNRDDEILREMHAAGKSDVEIAEFFGRTVAAVKQRRKRIRAIKNYDHRNH